MPVSGQSLAIFLLSHLQINLLKSSRKRLILTRHFKRSILVPKPTSMMNHLNFLKEIFVFFVFSLNYSYQIQAQCSSQGALSGTVFSDDNSTGVYTFNTPSDAIASDNDRAFAASLIGLLSGNTHYLKASSFGFSIPSQAVICGIEVEIEKSASNISLLATVEDNVVRLMKGGSIVGSNYATGANWTNSDAYYTYGGPSDLWGTSWTAADINANGFGLAFSARINGIISLLPIARVDHFQITVYYIIPVPIHFTGFNASLRGSEVLLDWSTADNDEPVLFEVLRSNGSEWTTIHQREGVITAGVQQYQFSERLPSSEAIYFYKIKMILRSGRVYFTSILKVQLFQSASLKVFPNPCIDYVSVIANGNPTIKLYSINGHSLQVDVQQISAGQFRMSTTRLKAGQYILSVNKKRSLLIVDRR